MRREHNTGTDNNNETYTHLFNLNPAGGQFVGRDDQGAGNAMGALRFDLPNSFKGVQAYAVERRTTLQKIGRNYYVFQFNDDNPNYPYVKVYPSIDESDPRYARMLQELQQMGNLSYEMYYTENTIGNAALTFTLDPYIYPENLDTVARYDITNKIPVPARIAKESQYSLIEGKVNINGKNFNGKITYSPDLSRAYIEVKIHHGDWPIISRQNSNLAMEYSFKNTRVGSPGDNNNGQGSSSHIVTIEDDTAAYGSLAFSDRPDTFHKEGKNFARYTIPLQQSQVRDFQYSLTQRVNVNGQYFDGSISYSPDLSKAYFDVEINNDNRNIIYSKEFSNVSLNYTCQQRAQSISPGYPPGNVRNPDDDSHVITIEDDFNNTTVVDLGDITENIRGLDLRSAAICVLNELLTHGIFKDIIVRTVDAWASKHISGERLRNDFLSGRSGVVDIYQLVVQIPYNVTTPYIAKSKLGFQVAIAQGDPFNPQSREQYSLKIWPWHNEVGWDWGLHFGFNGGAGGEFLTNQGFEFPLTIDRRTNLASVDWNGRNAVHEYVFRPGEFIPYAYNVSSSNHTVQAATPEPITPTPAGATPISGSDTSTASESTTQSDISGISTEVEQWVAKFNIQGTLATEIGVQVKLGPQYTFKEQLAFHGGGLLAQAVFGATGGLITRYVPTLSTEINSVLQGAQFGALVGSALYDIGAAKLGNRILGTQDNTRKIEVNYWGGFTFGLSDINGLPYIHKGVGNTPDPDIRGNINFGLTMYRRSWLHIINNGTKNWEILKKVRDHILRRNSALSQPGSNVELSQMDPGRAIKDPSGVDNTDFQSEMASFDQAITAAEPSLDRPRSQPSVLPQLVEAEVRAPNYSDKRRKTVRFNIPKDLSNVRLYSPQDPIAGNEEGITRLQLKRLAEAHPAITDFLVKAAEYQDVYLDAQAGSVTPLEFLARKERLEKEFKYTLDLLSKVDSGDRSGRSGFEVMNDAIGRILHNHTSETPYLDAYNGAILLKLIRESGYSGNRHFQITRDLINAIDYIGDYNRVAAGIVDDIEGLLQTGDVEDYHEAAKNWQQLDIRERSATARSIFDRILPAFRLEVPPKIKFSSSNALGERLKVQGQEIPVAVSFFDSNEIVLNLERFATASELVGTIGHELFHQYQKVQMERLLLDELSPGSPEYNFASIVFGEFDINASNSLSESVPYHEQKGELQAHAFGARMQNLAEDLPVKFAMGAAAKKIQAGEENSARIIINDVHDELDSSNHGVFDAIEEITDLSFQHNKETTEKLRGLVRENVLHSDQRQNFDDLLSIASGESSITGSETIESIRIHPERRISEFLQSVANYESGRVISNIENDIIGGNYTISDLIDAVRERTPYLNQEQRRRIFTTFDQISGMKNGVEVNYLEQLRTALYGASHGFEKPSGTLFDSYERVPLYQDYSGDGTIRHYDQQHNPMSEEEVASFFNRLRESVTQARNRIDEANRYSARLEAADLQQALLADLKNIAGKIHSMVTESGVFSWKNLRSVNFDSTTNEIVLSFKNEANPYASPDILRVNLEETLSGMKSGAFVERLHSSFGNISRLAQGVQHLGRGIGTWVALRSFKDMLTAFEQGDEKDALLSGIFTSIGVAQVSGLDRAVLNSFGRSIGRVFLKDADEAFKAAGKVGIGELDVVTSRGVSSLFRTFGASAGTAAKAGELFARVPIAAAVFGAIAIKGDIDTLNYDKAHGAPKWKQNLDIADIVLDSVDAALFIAAPFTGPAAPFVELAAVTIMIVRLFVDDVVSSIEAEEAKAHNDFERFTYGVKGFFEGIGKAVVDLPQAMSAGFLQMGNSLRDLFDGKESKFELVDYLYNQGADSASGVMHHGSVSAVSSDRYNYKLDLNPLRPDYDIVLGDQSLSHDEKERRNAVQMITHGVRMGPATAGNVVVDMRQAGRINVQWDRGLAAPEGWKHVVPNHEVTDVTLPRPSYRPDNNNYTLYDNHVTINRYDSSGYATGFSIRRKTRKYHDSLFLPNMAKIYNIYLGMGAAYTPKLDIEYNLFHTHNIPYRTSMSFERLPETARQTIYAGDIDNKFFAPNSFSLDPKYRYNLYGNGGDDVLHLASFGQYTFDGGTGQDLVSFSYAGIMKSVPEGEDPHDRDAIWFVDMQSQHLVRKLDSYAVDWWNGNFYDYSAQDHSAYMQANLTDVEGIITSNENAGVYRGNAERNMFVAGSKDQVFIRSAGTDSYLLHGGTKVIFTKKDGHGFLNENVGTDYVSIPFLYNDLSCVLDGGVIRIVCGNMSKMGQNSIAVTVPLDQVDQSINFISKDGILFNMENKGSHAEKLPKLIIAEKWLRSHASAPIGMGIDHDIRIDIDDIPENFIHNFSIAPSDHKRNIVLSSITFDQLSLEEYDYSRPNSYQYAPQDVGILLKYPGNHSIRLQQIAPGRENTASFFTKDGVCFSVDSRPDNDGFRNREVFFKDVIVKSAESKAYSSGGLIVLSDSVRSLLTQGEGALSQIALQGDSFKTDLSVLTRDKDWSYVGSDASELVQGDAGDNKIIASKGTDLLDGGNGYDQYFIHRGTGVNVLSDSGSDRLGSQVVFSSIFYQDIVVRQENGALLIGTYGDENTAAWVKIQKDEVGQYALLTQDGASFTLTADDQGHYSKALISLDYKNWYAAHHDAYSIDSVAATAMYALYGSDQEDHIYASTHTHLILPGAGQDYIYLPDSVDKTNTVQVNIDNRDGRNNIVIKHDQSRNSQMQHGQAEIPNTFTTVFFQGLERAQISQQWVDTTSMIIGYSLYNTKEVSVVVSQSDIGNFIFKDKNGVKWTASTEDKNWMASTAGFRLLGVDLSDERITTRRINLNQDVLGYSAFADTISSRGSNEADEIYGLLSVKNEIFSGEGSDRITGGNQNDLLMGGEGEDFIRGGKGDDLLIGGDGADDLGGGEGVDTISYTGDPLHEQGVAVNLATGQGNQADASGDRIREIENVHGSIFDDKLTGNADNNLLYGNAGNDVLQGDGGSDILSGGKGIDTYIITEGADVYIVETKESAERSILDMTGFGRDALSIKHEPDDTLLIFGENVKVRVENWSFVSQQFEMRFRNEVLSPSDVAVWLSGNNTADFRTNGAPVSGTANGDVTVQSGDTLKLAGSTRSGALVSLAHGTVMADGEKRVISNFKKVEGSEADDQFIGDANDNSFSGHGGDDIAFFSPGNDRYDGGSGSDRIVYHGAYGGITVNLGAIDNDGYAILSMGGKVDRLRSIEALALTDFNDQVTGNYEDNVFIGGLGSDTLDGAGGYDTLSFDVAYIRHVSVDLTSKDNSGWSTISLSGAGATRVRNIEKFVLSSGNDDFEGDDASQTIYAGRGDDFFHASLGNDRMDGGLGSDGITFRGVYDSYGIRVDITARDDEGWSNVYRGGRDDGAPVAKIRGIERIEGTEGNDVIVGDQYDNEIEGLGGIDQLDGGGGINTVSYRHSNKYWHKKQKAYVGVYVSLGENKGGQRIGTGFPNNTDIIKHFSNVVGSEWADEITGDDGDNVITGLGSSNAQGDLLDGGAGTDTVRFDTDFYNNGVSINLSKKDSNGWVSVARHGHSAFDSPDKIRNFENYYFSVAMDEVTTDTGSGNYFGLSGNDSFVLKGTAGGRFIDGGSNYDMVTIDNSLPNGGINLINTEVNLVSGWIRYKNPFSNDRIKSDRIVNIEKIETSNANDRIITSDRDDDVNTGYGDDVVLASGGADRLDGGDGANDTLDYHSEEDGILIDLVNDIVFKKAADKTDKIKGFERFVATEYDDIVQLIFGDGVEVEAGAGDDRLEFSSERQAPSTSGNSYRITGGEGNDTLSFADLEYAVQLDLGKTGSYQSVVKRSSEYLAINRNATESSLARSIGSYGGDLGYYAVGTIQVGMQVTGEIANNDPSDWFSFQAEQGKSYRVMLSSSNPRNQMTLVNFGQEVSFKGSIVTGLFDHHLQENGQDKKVMDFTATATGVYQFSVRLDPMFSSSYTTSDTYAVSVQEQPSYRPDLTLNISGIEAVEGSDQDDVLTGGSGNDTLIGNDGNDTISGGGGDDSITGGSGNDIYTASEGRDTYHFTYGDGNDRYIRNGAIPMAEKDVVHLEGNIQRESVLFNRIGNDLVMKLRDSQDSMTFEGWYDNFGTRECIDGFRIGQDFLAQNDVERLVTAMASFPSPSAPYASSYGNTGYGNTGGYGMPTNSYQNTPAVVNDAAVIGNIVWK